MGQVSSKLRRGEGRYFHWCPACKELHPLPDSWHFDGNLESPTFSPSFKHFTSMPDGSRSADFVPWCCHYVLTAGVLNFCSDCTHAMAGKAVPLPDLPPDLTD